MGKVGIFWFIADRRTQRLTILTARSFLDQSLVQGDFLVHVEDHQQYWLRLSRLGPANLAWRGLPVDPAFCGPGAFLRGEVVFDLEHDRFILFVPGALSHDAHRTVARAFDVALGGYIVQSVVTYRRTLRRNEEPFISDALKRTDVAISDKDRHGPVSSRPPPDHP